MLELTNDELLQWLQVRREQIEVMPPGTFDTFEKRLQKFAAQPETQKVLLRFLSLRPRQQRKVLACLSTTDSYHFRRMLGPEWTKEEDLAIEKAGREMWPDILAYAKANP